MQSPRDIFPDLKQICITDPPSAPRITVERNKDEADTSAWNDVRLECAVADAGHPRAALRWAVNGRPVEAAAAEGREDDGDVNSRSVTPLDGWSHGIWTGNRV